VRFRTGRSSTPAHGVWLFGWQQGRGNGETQRRLPESFRKEEIHRKGGCNRRVWKVRSRVCGRQSGGVSCFELSLGRHAASATTRMAATRSGGEALVGRGRGQKVEGFSARLWLRPRRRRRASRQ